MTRRRLILVASCLALLAGGGALWMGLAPAPSRVEPLPSGTFAGSESCRECHAAAFQAWIDSHHGRAEEVLDPARHGPAFGDGPRAVDVGQGWRLTRTGDRFEVSTLDAAGTPGTFPARRAIGVAPLWQLLVEAPGGRLQATSIAYDPARHDWFDVFGSELRRPGEWGYWAGRGMTWNSMCASCHTTDLAKNYDAASDAYATTFAELGVGCEACHGPAGDHVAARREGRPEEAGPRAAANVLDVCGPCHARREELVPTHRPGTPFLDRYRPVLPDLTDVYHADGQVRDEDFEYVSFLGSRMRSEGVTCSSCHDPHTARPKAEGNELCLTCHVGKVEPVAHGHHAPGTPGSACVDCHMPLTTYMSRHPRRDHGFTIPDPLLTVEFGIPNACNRCHEDRSPSWALDQTRRWYGDRMERPTRRRAIALARARRGEGGPEGVLAVVSGDPLPFWRTAALAFLEPWMGRPDVAAVVSGSLGHEDPLRRSLAARLLEPAAASHAAALARLLGDPVRLVRVDAAWALRSRLDLGSEAGRDLLAYLAHNADQPAGAWRLAVFHQDRGDLAAARRWMRHAGRLDPSSAELERGLAHLERRAGDAAASLDAFRRARALAPDDARIALELALVLAEDGASPARLAESEGLLERVVELEPRHARAWYDLALVRDRRGDSRGALEAIDEALRLAPGDPDFLTARAAFSRRPGG